LSKIHEKITGIIDEIQTIMDSDTHLDQNAEKLEGLLSKVSIYWAHIDDENSDYIHAVQYAIDHKISWAEEK
jgi:hypothetical protein